MQDDFGGLCADVLPQGAASRSTVCNSGFWVAVRTASYAVTVANLAHAARVLYVAAQSLENVGYGISVAVLYLAIFQFLRTGEQPRLPHAKALSALPIALVVPTAAFSVVLAPIGYAYMYERDDAASNSVGLKLLYASYWVRARLRKGTARRLGML